MLLAGIIMLLLHVILSLAHSQLYLHITVWKMCFYLCAYLQTWNGELSVALESSSCNFDLKFICDIKMDYLSHNKWSLLVDEDVFNSLTLRVLLNTWYVT